MWQALGSNLDSRQDTQAHAVHPRPLRGSAGHSQHCAGRSPPVRTGTHAQESAEQYQYDEGIPDALL